MAIAVQVSSALRARMLARWAAREHATPERDAARAALLDRCLAPHDGCGEPQPCRDVAAAHELAATAEELVGLSGTLRDLAIRERGTTAAELRALGERVDHAIAAHVEALEIGVEHACARLELVVPEGGAAADEMDYVWDLASDAMSWEDRRFSRSVPIAEDLGATRAAFQARIHSDDRDRVARIVREATERGDDMFWTEYRLRRPDGSWADVLERAVLVRSGERVVRAIGHLRERTMVRRLIRELEETRERLEAANAAADIGTFRVDRESRVTVRDGTLNRILGFPAVTTSHPYGETTSWVHPGDRERVRAEFDRAMAEGSVVPIDCRVVREDGTTRWIRGRGRGLRAEDGTVRWLTGAVVDVTAEHERAVERQLLLEEARRSRAEAEAASRAKEEFLALVSHELRGPLNAILGWVTLLRTDLADPAQRERALATVERNARAQSRLVEDLLDMSRVLSGKLRVELRALDLGALAADALLSWEPAAMVKSIDLSLERRGGSATVLGDAGRLQQVLSNLLGNAIKFTPRGGRIVVRVERAGDVARLTVRDTGPGIPESQRDRVFEPFRQAADGSRRESGLGLGLALVKTIVELHGGTVDARAPSEGPGAVLVVDLPCRQGE